MKKYIFILFAATILLSFTDSEPKGLQLGELAPNFTALNQDSKQINLHEMLKSGPVLLLFYRGEWCPYCNKQLKQLEDSLSYITKKGAKVIAVSPEKHENIIKTIKKTNASYSVVSDENTSIMNAYKVNFELDSIAKIKYKGYGIDLNDRNGTNGYNLPVPAVYIINKEGRITYRYFDTDYKKRASVQEIINHL